MNKIEETLLKRFENHRVIFLYDEKQELTELYQDVALDGVEKIEVNLSKVKKNLFDLLLKNLQNYSLFDYLCIKSSMLWENTV